MPSVPIVLGGLGGCLPWAYGMSGADRLSLVDPEKYEDLLKDAEAIPDGGE